MGTTRDDSKPGTRVRCLFVVAAAIGVLGTTALAASPDISSGVRATAPAVRGDRQQVTRPVTCEEQPGFSSSLPELRSQVIFHRFDGNSLDDPLITVPGELFDHRSAFVMSATCTEAIVRRPLTTGATVINMGARSVEVRTTEGDGRHRHHWFTNDGRVAIWTATFVSVPPDPVAGTGAGSQTVFQVTDAATGEVISSWPVNNGVTGAASRNGSLVLAGNEPAESLTILRPGIEVTEPAPRVDLAYRLSSFLKVSPQGKRLAAVHQPFTGAPIAFVQNLDGSVALSTAATGIHFLTDDEVVVCRNDGLYRIDLLSGTDLLVEAFDDYRVVSGGDGPPGMLSIRRAHCEAATR